MTSTEDLLPGQKHVPFWRSKKTASYWFTGLLLLVLALIGVDTQVLMVLAGAMAVSLPVLIGGESILDRRAMQASTAVALAQQGFAVSSDGKVAPK